MALERWSLLSLIPQRSLFCCACFTSRADLPLSRNCPLIFSNLFFSFTVSGCLSSPFHLQSIVLDIGHPVFETLKTTGAGTPLFHCCAPVGSGADSDRSFSRTWHCTSTSRCGLGLFNASSPNPSLYGSPYIIITAASFSHQKNKTALHIFRFTHRTRPPSPAQAPPNHHRKSHAAAPVTTATHCTPAAALCRSCPPTSPSLVTNPTKMP